MSKNKVAIFLLLNAAFIIALTIIAKNENLRTNVARTFNEHFLFFFILLVIILFALYLKIRTRYSHIEDKRTWGKELLKKRVGFSAGKGIKGFFINGPVAQLRLFTQILIVDARPIKYYEFPLGCIQSIERTYRGIKINHNCDGNPEDFYLTGGFRVMYYLQVTTNKHDLELTLIP